MIVLNKVSYLVTVLVLFFLAILTNCYALKVVSLVITCLYIILVFIDAGILAVRLMLGKEN